jgi:hypothetical protein
MARWSSASSLAQELAEKNEKRGKEWWRRRGRKARVLMGSEDKGKRVHAPGVLAAGRGHAERVLGWRRG